MQFMVVVITVVPADRQRSTGSPHNRVVAQELARTPSMLPTIPAAPRKTVRQRLARTLPVETTVPMVVAVVRATAGMAVLDRGSIPAATAAQARRQASPARLLDTAAEAAAVGTPPEATARMVVVMDGAALVGETMLRRIAAVAVAVIDLMRVTAVTVVLVL